VRWFVPILLLAGCHKPAPPIPSVPPSAPPVPIVDVPRVVNEARVVVRSHAADINPTLDLASSRVEVFFKARFARVDTFVNELFGWRGKWRATFWSREDYERHVRRAFERVVLRASDFDRDVLEPMQRDFAFAAAASENRTIADVHALVRVHAPRVEFDRFDASIRAELLSAVLADARMNVVSIGGSEAAAIGMGWALAAAGICAANSWWNAGASLVVGIVVAIVIDAFVGEASEDEARMKVHAELVGLRRQAVDGVIKGLAKAWLGHVARQESAVATAVARSLQ